MIPQPLYDSIRLSMPIPTVEAMIVKDDSLLFLRRKNSPAKDEWWFPGGMIRKGETFEEALLREVKEETGLDVNIMQFVGVFNRVFPERHDITIVFLCTCSGDKIILNNEHSEYRFFKDKLENMDPYLVETIKKAIYVTCASLLFS